MENWIQIRVASACVASPSIGIVAASNTALRLKPLRRHCRQETPIRKVAVEWLLACCNKRCVVGLSKKLELDLYARLGFATVY